MGHNVLLYLFDLNPVSRVCPLCAKKWRLSETTLAGHCFEVLARQPRPMASLFTAQSPCIDIATYTGATPSPCRRSWRSTRNRLQAKPAMLALLPVQHLWSGETRVLKASHRYCERALETFGAHEEHGAAIRAEDLLQPSTGIAFSTPAFCLAFLCDDSRIGVDGAVGKGRAGATLALQAGAGINTPRLSSENQLSAPTATTRCSHPFGVRHRHAPGGDALRYPQQRAVGIWMPCDSKPTLDAHSSGRLGQ